MDKFVGRLLAWTGKGLTRSIPPEAADSMLNKENQAGDGESPSDYRSDVLDGTEAGDDDDDYDEEEEDEEDEDNGSEESYDEEIPRIPGYTRFPFPKPEPKPKYKKPRTQDRIQRTGTVDLNLTENYGRKSNWGTREGARELIQNLYLPYSPRHNYCIYLTVNFQCG